MKLIVHELHSVSGEISQHANTGHYARINIPQGNMAVTTHFSNQGSSVMSVSNNYFSGKDFGH